MTKCKVFAQSDTLMGMLDCRHNCAVIPWQHMHMRQQLIKLLPDGLTAAYAAIKGMTHHSITG